MSGRRQFLQSLAVFAPVSLVFGQDAGEAAWTVFRNWYKDCSGASTPQEIMKGFTAHLKSQGMADEQIKAQIGMVQKGFGAHQKEIMPMIYDKAFTSPNASFKREPAEFVVKITEGLKPGRALDVAMGQGRNSIWLAKKGWDVTGYDISAAGLKEAQELAGKAGVKINTVQAFHDDFDYGVEQWDLIVMVFPMATIADQQYLGRVKKSLKKGGMVLVEQFNSPSSSGAKGPANALYQSFADMRVLHYEDTVGASDWGLVQKARIGRILAEKE